MTLDNFDLEIDEKIVERGCAYFHDGSVLELEEEENGVYRAMVEGSEDYTVLIILSAMGEILNHECDCPYDWGPYCKHEVAALYAIRKYMRTSRKEGAKHPKKRIFKTSSAACPERSWRSSYLNWRKGTLLSGGGLC